MEYHIDDDRLVLKYKGKRPRRNAKGNKTVLLKTCGTEDYHTWHRVVVVDAQGLLLHTLPCSSEVTILANTKTEFSSVALSPNEDLIAVSAYSLYDSSASSSLYVNSVLIYDLDGNVINTWQGGFDPVWTPDGRLLMATTDNGIFLTDQSLKSGQSIDQGQFSSRVSELAVHPQGQHFLFTYNGQIWSMNLDGSGAAVVQEWFMSLRSPAWSPDGSAFVFIAWDSLTDSSKKQLFFHIVDSREIRQVNLRGRMDSLGEPWPPLSWSY
jgi:Tol biopolymer transport system component